jgi:murein DD-endopeptidase MepM/ murein hydrolase activator NlpD
MIAFMLFMLGSVIIHGISCKSTVKQVEEKLESELKFGFDQSTHYYETVTVKPNQFLGDILGLYGIDGATVSDLALKAKDVYSVRMIRAGKDLTFVKKDSCSNPFCFIYEPNPFSYITYEFGDTVDVCRSFVDYETCIETASGVIETSLWSAMIKNGLTPGIIDKMEDALASSVDFYHTQKGDEFKLLFERKYIKDRPVSIGQILGAYYKNEQGEFYSVYFKNDKYDGFYDKEGRANTSAFLRSPVKYSRISSKFNRNRFHPILKRRKAHLGTDYAAPRGTPIRAVADGTISRRGYTEGNGKYIKVKHNKTYSSQYLHMHNYAKGIRNGVRVKQGQTIGYVGSTGLATGPHVCFRFWKNGRQINHLREIFPPSKPMKKEDLPLFYDVRDDVVFQLQSIPAATLPPAIVSTDS